MFDRIVLDKDFTLCFVKCSERMGYPYEEWIEIRCGTCKATNICEDRIDKFNRGCDKWQVE